MLCKCSGKYIDIYFNLKITYCLYIFSSETGGGVNELRLRFIILLLHGLSCVFQ